MAGTTISELGKMFNHSTQAVQGTESNTRITTGKVDFGSMMNQSGNRQTASYAGIDHIETVKTAANGSKDTVKAADDYQKYQYKDNTIASEIKQVTSEDVVKEQFEQFTEDVKEVLKEELGVSDEAIEAAMQTLGLQFQDLLNQNNLANLVAELTGADSVPQLLCSEQFVNVLQSVNDIGKDILNALGEKAPETWDDFARICQEATKDTDGDGKDDQYGLACGMNTSDIGAMQILNEYYYSALWQNGGQVYNDDLKSVSFADEAGKEAVTWLKGLTSYMNEDYMSLSWSEAFSNVFGA